MKNEYLEQAEKFLNDTNTTLEVVKAVPQKAPLWGGGKHGINYSVTLTNKHHKYTFDYWGSLADVEKLELAKEAQRSGIYSSAYFAIKDWCEEEASQTVPATIKGKKRMQEYTGRAWLGNVVEVVETLITPNAYDILACLDVLHGEDFKEFCDNFGYNEDSITALKTFEACREQDRNLRILFDRSQLEALAEIQ